MEVQSAFLKSPTISHHMSDESPYGRDAPDDWVLGEKVIDIADGSNEMAIAGCHYSTLSTVNGST